MSDLLQEYFSRNFYIDRGKQEDVADKDRGIEKIEKENEGKEDD